MSGLVLEMVGFLDPMPAQVLALFSDDAPLMIRHFAGAGYITMEDHVRLDEQHLRIRNFMADGAWRTLAEIHEETGYPEASISAQLRHMRKVGFGSHKVEKRHRGPGRGLWEYQLTLNPEEAEKQARRYYHAKHPGGPNP